ncbi:MAG: flippase [Deltaproteobacteria bacterium]|nr:flippase [Deltaproteobacteria bacterium]
MGPAVLRNALFSMVGQLSARLLALVFYALLARMLGPERYGDQGFGAAVGTLFVVLLEPGLIPMFIRDAARDRSVLERRLAALLGYKLMMLTLVWPASVLAAWAAGYHGDPLWAVVWAGGTILVASVEDACAGALTAVERLDLESSLRVVSKVVTVTLGGAALLTHQPFAVVVACVCAGAATAAATGVWFLGRAGIRLRVAWEPGPMFARVREAWPLAVHNVMWLLTLRLDQVMASAMGVPHDALGGYNGAVKVVEALILFPNAVALAFQPRLARAWAGGREACAAELRPALAASLGLTLAVAVGGALLADGLAVLVYGERFRDAGPLLAIQLACLPLVGVQFLGACAMVAAGRIRLQAVTVAANFGVNVALNLLLVPRFGVAGASWAAVGGGAAGAVVYAWGIRAVGLRAGWAAALLPAGAACAAMAAVVGLVVPEDWPVLTRVAAGAVVYAPVYWAAGGGRAIRALWTARHTPGNG